MSSGGAVTGDPIKHVLVLALENRSFDHMIGACPAVKPAIDGIDPAAPVRINSYAGQSYPQAPGASRIVADDPRHETPHVLVQMKADAPGVPNTGFVEDYATAYPMLTEAGRAEIMKYHDLGQVPAIQALAQNFTVCDAGFHPCPARPGPTGCS